MAKKSLGRPIRGEKKRVRASFTLHADHMAWLRAFANTRQMPISSALDQALELARQTFSNQANPVHALPIAIPQQALQAFCQTHQIKTLSLFGSVLTDRFSDRSDIDILVEFKPKATPGLMELAAMQRELERMFADRKIDLRTVQEISPYFRHEVIKKSLQVYGPKAA